MQLTVDINTKKMTDATGMVALAAVDKPQLFYGTRETLEFTFLNDGEPVNFTDTDTPLFYYKGSGSETSLNQSQLEKYFGLSGLDGKRVHTRLYDVTVKVNRENKEITTLTGTVTR